MSSAIKTPAFQAKASNIQNEDNSSIYSGGAWSFKNASAVTGFHVDADGKVGIGTTSAISKLDVQKDSTATNPGSDQIFPAWTSGAVLKNASATDGAYSGLSFLTSNLAGTTQGFSIVGQSTASGYSSNLLFMARTASGTTTERMRIDASGKVYVGTDIFAGSHRVARSWPSGTVRIMEFQAGAVVRGGIDWNGTTLSLATGSDERLKENIRNLEDIGLDKINQIKVRRYEMKESSVPGVGFIAQEMEKVLPEAVSNVGDYLSVSYNEMTPYLVKAIQEQQAMIEELKAKVSALESK